MKASEVLKRYADRDRDFRRVNLHGQSFKGEDLSEADFSEADIRGTNFTNATLRGANFTKTKAGVQRRWMIVQLILSFVFSVLFNFVAALLNAAFLAYFFIPDTIKQMTILPGLTIARRFQPQST